MTEPVTPTDRRAALRLALDAADRACQERQALARKIADAADAAAARGMIVALDYAIDREQAALDALEPFPDGGRKLADHLVEVIVGREPAALAEPVRPGRPAVSVREVEQRPDPRPAASAPPASPPPAATTSSPTAAPAAAEPPSGLALPAHWHNGGWSFLDPGDCRVAAEHGIPQWFPAEDQCAVAAMVKEKTGRTLLCFDPPKKEKKPRKPRAKGAGPGEQPAAAPQETAAQEVDEQQQAEPDEGNGFLPGFEPPATRPTAQTEGA